MIYLFLFLLGVSIASFLNVVIVRVPTGDSVVLPRSKCPTCETSLAWYDLVPILSFAALKGTCRYCEEKISWRYPLIELLGGVFVVVLYSALGASFVMVQMVCLMFMLIAVAEIDREHGIVPNVILIWGVAFSMPGIIWSSASSPGETLLAAISAGGALYLIRLLGIWLFKKPGMGMGDVKLAVVLGLYLGWSVFAGLYIAIVLAGTVGIIGLVAGRLKRKSHLPFAPFIALGMVLFLVLKQVLIV